MGSNSWLVRVALTVAVHVLGLMTSSQEILDGQMFFCNSTPNVTSDCCLYCDFNATCNNTCPEGQLTLNLTKSIPSCVFTNDSDSNAMSSEDQSRDFVTVCVTICPVGYYPDGNRCEKCDNVCENCTGPGIKENCECPLRYNGECVKECEKGFYNDNGICEKCDNACHSCNASGRGVDTCDCKFEFNGTCYDSCQPNITSCDNEEENNTALIIGIAVGGGLVFIIIVIIVIVIIVKCCRRRQGSRKTRMSTLIETRNAGTDEEEQVGDVQLPKVMKGKKPGKYENVQVLGSNVSAQAQDTQDKKTRYTPDPTLPRGKTLEDHSESQPDRSSALYMNAGAIKLSQNIAQGSSKDSKLNRGVFNKFKKSLMGIKSKKEKDNSVSTSGTANPVFNEGMSSSEGEEYCDMTRKIPSDDEQEDYVQVDHKVDNEPQEDYENIVNTFKTNLRDENNFGNTSKSHLNDDEPQEEYENFMQIPKDSFTNEEPQEEYENFQGHPNADDEPQDEYENFDQTSAAAMGNAGRGKNLYQEEESPYVNVTHFKHS